MNQCQLKVLKVITLKKAVYVFQKKMCCHGGTIGYSIRYLYWAVKTTNRLAEQTPCHTAQSRSSVALIYFLSAILSYCFFFNLLECHCLTLFLCRNMKISVHLLRSLWSNKLCTDIPYFLI